VNTSATSPGCNIRGDFGATLVERTGEDGHVHLLAEYPPLGAADYGLLIGLGLLALTGMLTLLLRATPAYGLVLVTHLTTIVVCLSLAPYTRFVHSVYRFLAIAADNIESRQAGVTGSSRPRRAIR
jgi:hypothetical protein